MSIIAFLILYKVIKHAMCLTSHWLGLEFEATMPYVSNTITLTGQMRQHT